MIRTKGTFYGALMLPVFLSLSIASCPSRPPVQPRAFAVDVQATSGTVTLGGWDCEHTNADWCNIPQPIQNKGTYGHVDFPALSGTAPAMNFKIRGNGYEPLDCTGSIPAGTGSLTAAFGVPLIANRYNPVGCPDHLTSSFPPARQGVVFPDGKAIRDDGGNFHAEGLTFFWAMQGQHNDPARFLANVKFISEHNHPDYVRILAYVDWAGNNIDPNWPDYEQTLATVIDTFYQYGIRVEVTIMGSPYSNPVELAHRVARVTSQRANKVIAIETWNEWSQNGGSISAMIDMVRVLKAESGIALIGLSSGDDLNDAYVVSGATLRLVHPDRGPGDNDWRQVRQCYDAKDMSGVVDFNEPGGPNSSVNTLSGANQLALFRACTAQSGGAMWVLHVGDMVMGVRDPAHHRMPNIWQVGCETDDMGANTPDNPCPYIVTVLKAVRSIDPYLADSEENWRPKSAGNPNIQPQALKPDNAGSDGFPVVNRAYAAFNGPNFVQTLLGVNGDLGFQLTTPYASHCQIKGLNPLTGETLALSLNVGDRTVIHGDGNTGYVLVGSCQ